MLTFLPAGLLGLLIAALVAALMSTISTHLNWGSSYVVYDFYKRFVNPRADERTLVSVGRWATVGLMILAAVFALFLSNALQAFQILLQIGAGTGLLFILRWFWWRINAITEIVAMLVSFIMAVILQVFVGNGWEDYEKLLCGIGVTTLAWVITAFVTKPADMNVMVEFVKKIKPYPYGWKPVLAYAESRGQIKKEEMWSHTLGLDIASMFLGCILVYSLLFGTGYLIYGSYTSFFGIMALAVFSGTLLWIIRRKTE